MVNHEAVTGPLVFTLAQGDRMEIGLHGLADAGFRRVGNYQTVAEITIGGATWGGETYQLQDLLLLRAEGKEDEDYRLLMERAQRQAITGTADFVLAAMSNEDGQAVKAVAPLPTRASSGLGKPVTAIIGRLGNVHWFRYGDVFGSQHDGNATWTPFKTNYGISDIQFDITPGSGGVTLTGLAANDSMTLVKAIDVVHKKADGSIYSTEEHEAVVAQQREAVEQRTKLAKVVGTVLRDLKQ